MSQADDADDFNSVEARNNIVARLKGIAQSPKYEGHPPMVDVDDDGEAFLERALEEAVELVAGASGRHPSTSSKREAYNAVDDLLTEENIEEIDLRANGPYAAPKLTIWLKKSAQSGKPWANVADQRTFSYQANGPHYNGRSTMAIVDVRPF